MKVYEFFINKINKLCNKIHHLTQHAFYLATELKWIKISHATSLMLEVAETRQEIVVCKGTN